MYVWLPHWQQKMPSQAASCPGAVYFVHPCFRRYTGELVKPNVSLEKSEDAYYHLRNVHFTTIDAQQAC